MSSHIRRLLLTAIGVSLAFSAAQAQYTITGTVRDPGANPVASVEVTLYTEQGDPIGGINPAITNGSGFYSLGTGLIPAGTYNVEFIPPSATELLPRMVTGVIVGGNTTLDVTLETGFHLTGFVRDTTGAGIPDIDLNAYYEPDGQAIILANDNTGPDGSYDVLLPAGLLRIVYRPVQGESLAPVELRNVNIAGDTSIDITMRTGFLVSGTVAGPGGAPVPNADIDVEDAFTGIKIYTPGDNTGPNGDYQIRIPAGIYHISAGPAASTHLVPEIVYGVAVSDDIDIDFALEPGFVLSGTVRNSLSEPVVDADIDVAVPATGERLFTPSDNTNPVGFYQVVIPPGIYDVDYKPAVVPPYLAPLRQFGVAVTADLVLDVTVPGGRLLSGQVRNIHGAGVANVNLDAKDSLGQDMPLVGDYTIPGGNFAMVVASGLYDIEIEPSHSSALAPKLLNNVRVRIDTSILVVVDTGMAVSGIVRDSLGGPFANVNVLARRSDTGEERFTPGNRTDINGYYRIAIPPNTYDLVYRPDPVTGVPDSVILPGVSVTTDLSIDVTFPIHSGDTSPPAVEVLSPNGGENFSAFDVISITWSASDNVGVAAIDIYYSVSGPLGPYTPIAIDEENDGTFAWEIPAEPTNNAWIRIMARDAAFNVDADTSDAAFAIVYSAFCCGELKGDVNSNGIVNGIDVVYFVGYLKGGPAPPDNCMCGSHGWLYAAADVNGNCQANGIDVTYMVSFFKGGPGFLCCPDCPPAISGQRKTGFYH